MTWSFSRFDGLYCGPPPLPADLWHTWNFDPPLMAALLCMAVFLHRSRFGFTAVVVLALIFLSPLCALSSALFSARVVHHVLLMTVAAPLFAMSLPSKTNRGLSLPLLAFATVLWVWHLPTAYDWAMAQKAAYWLMQVTMFSASVWFWRAAFDRPALAAIPAVTAGFAQMGLLGSLLTFAPTPLYAIHALAPFDWSPTPLADQQLAGLIMWVPSAVPFLAIVGILARRQWREMAEA
jgi:putative membrane protein